MGKNRAGPKLPLRKKLLFTALVLVPFVVLLEGAMRLCGYGPQPGTGQTIPRPDPLEYFAIADPYLGFRNRPHGRYRFLAVQGKPCNTTDEHGYRNGFGWTAEGDCPIVLFLGDSIIFGAEVSDDETAPSEVAKRLAEKFHVRVLNAAVRGYSTLQSKRMLIKCFERFPCIKVAVYTHCGNDYEENLVPNIRCPAKAPVIIRDPETGQFGEVEVSDPVVPWGESFYGWSPVRPPPSTSEKVIRWLGAHSGACDFLLAKLRRLDSQLLHRYEFPDGTDVVPPEDFEKWNDWARRNGGDEVLQQLLKEMHEICRSHGAAFVATDYLTGLDGHTSAEFAANCAEAGVQFVGLDDQFADASPAFISRLVDGQSDAHYSPVGTKAYAAAIAPALERILQSQASRSASESSPAGHH